MTRLTPPEKELARQLLAGGWTIAKVAHAIARRRYRAGVLADAKGNA